MHDAISRIPNTREPKLNIVLESGHPNAPDAVRLYNWSKDRIGQSRALAGMTFAKKGDSLPLAAADLFAYTALGLEIGQKPIGVPRKPTKAKAHIAKIAFSLSLIGIL